MSNTTNIESLDLAGGYFPGNFFCKCDGKKFQFGLCRCQLLARFAELRKIINKVRKGK